MARLTNNWDIIMEIVTSGRTIPVDGIADIFGPCLKTLPLRVNLSHSKLISDLIKHLHRLNRWLLSSSDASIQEIRKVSHIAPGVPLSDVLFIWQETLDSKSSQSGGFKILDQTNHVRSRLLLEIEPRGDLVFGKATLRDWCYNTNVLFSKLDQILDTILQSFDKSLDILLPSITCLPTQSAVALPLHLHEEALSGTEWTTTESIIRDCLVEATAIPKSQVQKHVSMFRYGVDSIIAIQLARLLREHGISASGLLILQNPTISKFASTVKSNTKKPESSPLNVAVIISQSELVEINTTLTQQGIKVDSILPCTPLQEAMLSANLITGTEAYCNVMLFKVIGDLQKLMESCEKVFRRHPIFQTIFIQTLNRDHPFVQGVLSSPVIRVDNDQIVLGHDNLNPAIVVPEGGRLMTRLREKFMPPVTLTILRCQRANYLRLICHHALYDASAIKYLIHEIESEYRGQSLNVNVSTESFLEIMINNRSEEAKDYWMSTVNGFKPVLIFHDKSRPTSAPKYTLKSSLKLFQDICRSQSMTLGVLLEATFSRLLCHLLRVQDICFGTVVSGRNHDVENLDQLVFPTFNIVPLRLNLSTLSDNTTLITKLKEFHRKSAQYNLYPLRLLQQEVASSAGEGQLFSMLLLIQQGPYVLDRTIWELSLDAGAMEVCLHWYRGVPH
jgi:aryl carrier-like protein